MSDISLPMLILFSIFTIFNISVYTLSRNKYNELINPLDKKMYKLKDLLGISLYILEKIRYKYNTKYDRKILIKISELSGHRFSQYYLCIHIAHKLAFIILALNLCLFFGVFIGPSNEFFIFTIIVNVLIFFLTDKEINNKISKRKLSIQIDFPDFLNKLTLLINAGMTVFKAIEKIVAETMKISPLFEELNILVSDVKGGIPETQSYENFAKRCRIPEITKFIAVILQNMRKGNSELVLVLRLMSTEAFEMRKAVAKRLGEEASTKLLLPLIIMFLAIVLIVATPAVLAMRGISG